MDMLDRVYGTKDKNTLSKKLSIKSCCLYKALNSMLKNIHKYYY